jgi:TolB protein
LAAAFAAALGLQAAELPGHRLLVTSVRTGDTEVFIANPATGDMLNVSRSPSSEDRYPCWSPDGEQIAFVSDRQGATNLWVMDNDGGNVRRLITTPAVCYMPSWQVTPEGERIVFGLHGDKPEMAGIKPDGTGLQILGEGHDPTLSPDGQRICYTGHPPEGGVTVYVMNWDGADKRRVLPGSSKVGATFPNWSPDAKRLVYSWPVGDALELFIVDADGANNHQLTRLGQIATPAAWSPDGQWISFRLTDERYWSDPKRMVEVYTKKPADKRPVWVVRPDGSAAHALESLRFQMAIDGSRASWQPAKRYPQTGALPDLFPERGAGAKHLPDDTYVLPEPRRTREQLAALDALMPGSTFTAPSNRWGRLPKTRDKLTTGGALHVVNLGDSIVNDTARSGWLLRLQDLYPKASIRMTTVVRGGAGCWYYKENDRIRDVVAPLMPDLVFIGGLSQRGDVDSIREVIRQLRQQVPGVEILLGTAAWGRMDPLQPETLPLEPCSGYAEYGPKLKALADELHCGFVDVTRPWAGYIQQSGWRTDDFKRDAVHANSRGEQILGRIMAAWFAAK